MCLSFRKASWNRFKSRNKIITFLNWEVFFSVCKMNHCFWHHGFYRSSPTSEQTGEFNPMIPELQLTQWNFASTVKCRSDMFAEGKNTDLCFNVTSSTIQHHFDWPEVHDHLSASQKGRFFTPRPFTTDVYSSTDFLKTRNYLPTWLTPSVLGLFFYTRETKLHFGYRHIGSIQSFYKVKIQNPAKHPLDP